MDLVTLLLLAVALCFDSFAVSLSCGMVRCCLSRWTLFRFSAVLALSQGIMTGLGWGIASRFAAQIEAYDHWIAFVLLLFLGGKMLWESFSSHDDEKEQGNPFGWGRNLLLGVATSIDAVVAGAALALTTLTILPKVSQGGNIAVAVLIIFLVTLAASLIGLLVGRRSRGRLGERAEMIGGIILILIGVKVLIEHFS